MNQQQKYCSSEDEKLYLNLFQPRNLGNDDDFLIDFLCLPSVAILCLHFEFILTDPHKMCKFPKCVQNYISVALDAKLDIHEALSSFYFEVPEEFTSKEQSAYMLLKEEIRKLCGDEVFYNEWHKLVNLRYSFATGLAPAYSQFMQIRCKSFFYYANLTAFIVYLYGFELVYKNDVHNSITISPYIQSNRPRSKAKFKETRLWNLQQLHNDNREVSGRPSTLWCSSLLSHLLLQMRPHIRCKIDDAD